MGGPSASVRVDAHAFLHLPPSIDSKDVLVSAWVWLDQPPPGDETIRTLLSSKGGGCEARKPDLYGMAISVNAWGVADRRVHVELGNEHSGCHKMDSGSVILPLETWHFLSVALTSSGFVQIFVNGALANAVSLVPHMVADVRRKISVGRYADGSFPFFGNISTLTIVHLGGVSNDIEAREVAEVVTESLYRARDPLLATLPALSSLAAYYPLAMTHPIVHELVKGGELSGKYFMSSSKDVISVELARPANMMVDGLTETLSRRTAGESPQARLDNIRGGMQFVWKNYEKYAWGKDELKPISMRGQDNWGGLGVTLVDSLDTLWLMGLKDEFWRARDWVRDSLHFGRTGSVSVFETTIRELGGLLAAYDMSKDEVFLGKAKDLGQRLIKAFHTRSGIPTGQISLRSSSGSKGGSGAAVLSELGSLQLEFRYLAEITGDVSFETASMKALQVMHRKMPASGLFSVRINMADGGAADSLITLGALGDSFYEYLLKIWLQGGRKEEWLRTMYDTAVNGIVNKLLQFSTPSGLAYLADWTGRTLNHKMDHLVCFLPGTLALGAYTDPLGIDSPRAQRDLELSKALMYTCYQMYHRMESGISAEYVQFQRGKDLVAPSHVHFYILRPETAESLFVLFQLTGIAHYQEWAWEIWRSIDKHCRKGVGYGALRNVHNPREGVDDRMESFFLGETLKYLYLVQDPEKGVDLMKVVLNTEAHPFSILSNKHRPIPPA
jgi:mannosyl-oligosaccharide alpha-1,2-mannosidase